MLGDIKIAIRRDRRELGFVFAFAAELAGDRGSSRYSTRSSATSNSMRTSRSQAPALDLGSYLGKEALQAGRSEEILRQLSRLKDRWTEIGKLVGKAGGNSGLTWRKYVEKCGCCQALSVLAVEVGYAIGYMQLRFLRLHLWSIARKAGNGSLRAITSFLWFTVSSYLSRPPICDLSPSEAFLATL